MCGHCQMPAMSLTMYSLHDLKKIIASSDSVDYSVPSIVLFNQQNNCDDDIPTEEEQLDGKFNQPQQNACTMSPE